MSVYVTSLSLMRERGHELVPVLERLGFAYDMYASAWVRAEMPSDDQIREAIDATYGDSMRKHVYRKIRRRLFPSERRALDALMTAVGKTADESRR